MANESLQANFGLDIAPLTQSLKRATSSVADATSKMGKESFGSLLAPIAKVAAAIGSVGAIMEGLHGALELGAQMQDLSNRTGIAVENLVGLRKAFKDSGVAAEAIGPAVAKMQKSLAASAGGGGESNLLRALGLDAKTLASESPDKAFLQIGNAIRGLNNPTEQAAAAMKIFGRSGTELLAVFNSPAFQKAGNVSDTAKILGENAASFKQSSEALGHVGSKLSGFFVGMASSFVPALHESIEDFEKLDLSPWGVAFGNVIGNFSTDWKNEFSKLTGLTISLVSLAFNPVLLKPLGIELLDLATRFGDSIRKSFSGLKGSGDSSWFGISDNMAQAGIMTMVEKFLDKSSQDKNFSQTYQENLKMIRGGGLGETIDAQSDFGRSVLNSGMDKAVADLRNKISEIVKASGAFVATPLTLAANAKGREEAKSKFSIPTGSFDSMDLGGSGKASIIADSFAKVGGGGSAVFLGLGDVARQQLTEQKKTNELLMRISAGGSYRIQNGVAVGY